MTSIGDGVEYTNSTSNGPMDTCLDTRGCTVLRDATSTPAAITTKALPRSSPGTARTSQDGPASFAFTDPLSGASRTGAPSAPSSLSLTAADVTAGTLDAVAVVD
jgi:hypothetical protein